MTWKKIKDEIKFSLDNIQSLLIRECSGYFTVVSTEIINSCRKTKTFPDIRKKSRFCTILKKNTAAIGVFHYSVILRRLWQQFYVPDICNIGSMNAISIKFCIVNTHSTVSNFMSPNSNLNYML